MPSNDFEYAGYNKRYRVLNEVRNRFETFSYRTLLNRIKSGKVKEVDPFLHSLFNANAPAASFAENDIAATLQDKVKRFTERFPVPRFKTESARVRVMTYRKATEFKRKALPVNHQNIEVVRKDNEDEDKSTIYAIIDTLYAISANVYKDYKITLVVHYQDPDLPFLYPHYYHINEETVQRLKELINTLFYGAPAIQIDDSDKYTLYAMSEWAQMNIEFVKFTKPGTDIAYKNNRLEEPVLERNRRRTGARWSWLNTTPIDLSKFGIFNTFNPNNYKYSCFVYALEKSGMLTKAEIEYVKTVINTKHFPMDNITKLCKKLDISIKISIYNPQDKTKHSDIFGSNETRQIKLLLRDNHYMLDENVNIAEKYIRNYKYIDSHINPEYFEKRYLVSDLNDKNNPKHYAKKPININRIIDLFFECKYFKPLSNKQLQEVFFAKRDVDFSDLTYPDCCARPVEYKTPVKANKNVIYTSDIDKIAYENPESEIIRFKGHIQTVQTRDAIYKNSSIWFPFSNPTDEEINRFKTIMQSKFRVTLEIFLLTNLTHYPYVNRDGL
jgi:hypothetical protein